MADVIGYYDSLRLRLNDLLTDKYGVPVEVLNELYDIAKLERAIQFDSGHVVAKDVASTRLNELYVYVDNLPGKVVK